MKTYRCIARIRYEVLVDAESKIEAEQIVFEALADDIVGGVINTEALKSDELPMLISVEVC